MRTLPILATLGAVAMPASLMAQDFEWSGRLATGMAVEVKGINGDIEALPASGNQVEVTAVKREGRRGYAEEVTFEVVEHDGGITICAMYPSEPGKRENECREGGHGHMSVHDNDTEVDFTVRVPAGVDLVARTVNGNVDTGAMGGDVWAFTVNGSIEITAAGYAHANTVNGSIRAHMGRSDWQGDLEFQTVNGSITVELPADLSARVEASTVNGDMQTDFPLTIQGRWGPRRLSGTIGEGGRTLRLSTVNGGISLQRGG
ncbi:MAG: DUF4097 family beta strand repeat protein [Gemmatimonadota bacterium]|nr:MAG: DUF4097 family beta strand repeat protein [Gemmatimonadota bacterium]